jgi:superfamily I DNA/RNA helicase
MIKYTPEQADVMDHITAEDGILLVEAGAGTGKSFMSEQIVRQLQPTRGLYTAFNKAIVEEGVPRFKGTNVECKTLHALAYKYVRPNQEIHDITYTCITEHVSYAVKYEVIQGINQFYVSASTDMYEYFDEYYVDHDKKPQMVDLSIKYIEKMIEKEINPTFNFLLKYFHLMLVEGSVDCSYDLVILDEINDTTAVALEIFKLINAPKKLGLGETNQAIYEFLNLVNGFELLENAPILKLTNSFRCSELIAAKIQTFMRQDVSEEFTFVGTDDPVANGLKLYCTATNSAIIHEIVRCQTEGKGFTLLRKLSEIFAYPMAIVTSGQGKTPYQKKYLFLKEEYENYEKHKSKGQNWLQWLIEQVQDPETTGAVNLLATLKRQNHNLFDIYKKAQNSPADVKYTIATVFTSKGLEFEEVVICDDLNRRIQTIRDNGGIKTHTDLVDYRCYYVACSRAGSILRNATML